MCDVRIELVSREPETYGLIVFGEKVGVGSYEAMFMLGAQYDKAFEPEADWQESLLPTLLTILAAA